LPEPVTGSHPGPGPG